MALTILGDTVSPDPNSPAFKRANEELLAAFEKAFAWPLQAIALAVENNQLREEIERMKAVA